MIKFGDFGDNLMQTKNSKIEVSWSNDESLQAQGNSHEKSSSIGNLAIPIVHYNFGSPL